MRKTANILGIPVDCVTMHEAVKRIGKFIKEGGVHAVYTPNSEIMMAALKDPVLKDILLNADMLTADGAGVVLASGILGCRVPEKVSGVDLVINIFKAYAKKGIRVFLFGSKPGVAEEAAENIARDYPGIVIAGCRNGYFTADQEEEIISEINAANADILLVALGAPKQEYWISGHKDKLNSRVCIGVGGTLDVLSGRTRLAPDFFRRNGLEWFYRLCMEPKRAVRMLNLPRFMLRVLFAAIKTFIYPSTRS
ncbi:MAG: WecB/TagA/CpsF family glycosyltransferase [Acetivibrionales bacterium]|jgi:N-acetylglucosaminyldiphosphoundecaprenol N-acetyl-beta-D-mannosaminyltransferase